MTDEAEPKSRGCLVVAIPAGAFCLCSLLVLLTPLLAMELLYGGLAFLSLLSLGVVGISYSYATLLARRDLRVESTIVLVLVTVQCCVTAKFMHFSTDNLGWMHRQDALRIASIILFVGAVATMVPWILPRRKHGAGQISLATILFTIAVFAGLYALIAPLR